MTNNPDTSALIEHTPFDIVVPEPGETLRAHIIHPDNLEIIEKAQSHRQFLLPNRMVKRLEKSLSTLNRRLDQEGCTVIEALLEDKAAEFKAILQRRAEIKQAVSQTTDRQQLRTLHREWQNLNQRASELRQQAEALSMQKRALAPLLREKAAIEEKLYSHNAAVAREQAYQRVRKGLTQEAQDWHDIIQNALTGMGFCYRYSERGREYTQRVKFAEIDIGLDAIYLKILTTSKTAFGWRWHIPRNVNPIDMTTPEVEHGLTIACERQVEAIYNKNTGLFYRINRLGVSDGLIEKVSYSDVMAYYDVGGEHSRVPVPVGVRQGLVIEWCEIARYPHFLIAGASGSGKSNLIKIFISTIITRQDPERVRLILVDMKEGVEFKIYEDNALPHLIGNVVTTPPQFLTTLAQLEKLRIERTEKMLGVYATELEDYNARVPVDERMPRIVVIIDEFSAIYMSDPFQDARENQRIATQIKSLVRQLLAKARAAGIHLIICTQSPYTEILPGVDKANITVKIVGRFLDKNVSRAVLGVGAAADIPEEIKGRMIVQTSGQMFMIQTPLVTNEDRTAAIQKALTWDKPPVLQLQAGSETVSPSNRFTREDLLKLSVNEYGGKLSVRRMWNEVIKHTGQISIRQLEEMIAGLSKEQIISYQDTTYRVVKVQGGGYALKFHTPTVPQDSGIRGDDAETAWKSDFAEVEEAI